MKSCIGKLNDDKIKRYFMQMRKLKRLFVAYNQIERLPEQLGHLQVSLLNFVFFNLNFISHFTSMFGITAELLAVLKA